MHHEKREADLFLRWGEADQVLVFLHYFGGAAASWRWTASPLQSEYQCLALNLFGFGGTPAIQPLSIQHYAKTIQAQLQQLKVNSYHLIGHSMGGKIALQMAANQAPGLKQLILLAPSPPTNESMPESEKERLLNNPQSRATALHLIDNSTQVDISPIQKELAVQTHLEMSDTVLRWWLREGMTNSIAAHMHRIQVPVTAILSKDDPVIPYDKIHAELRRWIPHTKFITANGVGHLMPFEAPEFVARSIRHTFVPDKSLLS